MKKRGILKKVIFGVEVVVLMLLIGALYVYGQFADQLQLTQDTPEITLNDAGEVERGEIKKNEEAPRMTGYRTYALFGIDHRDKNEALAGENSDTMIICSINNDTKEVRLVSVFRDTLLNIGNDIYAKCNAAYAYGGPQQAVNMLNDNLDLNITDYITIDFNALVEAVDALGGLDVPMSYAEIVHMNNYCKETSEETGKSYTPVELPAEVPENQEEIIGQYLLNGVQVTSYCRIRYTSKMDMGRTERQRYTIQSIISKARTAGLPTIFALMEKVFPMVKTSLNQTEILSMIPQMMDYNIANTGGFPGSFKFSNVRGSIIVPTTLVDNVAMLHEFLYGTTNYEPSDKVKAYSEKILAIVGGEENMVTEAPVVSEEIEGTAADIFIWQDDGSGGNVYEDYNLTDYSGLGDYTGGTATEGTGTEETTAPTSDASPGTETTPATAETGGETAPGGEAAVPGGEGEAAPAPSDGGAAEPAVVDPGAAEPVVVDPGTTDPGTGGGDVYVEPDTGGGDVYVDPGTGGGDVYVDPGAGGGDYGGDYGGETGGEVYMDAGTEG